MTDIIDNNKLVELVIEKHNKFLEAFNSEFSELENKLRTIKDQSGDLKKEMEMNDSRINVLNEKYFLFFHQAKKQREEIFRIVLEKMRELKAPNVHEIMRLSGRIEEYEKKLQHSKNIDDEDKTMAHIKGLLNDFENEARKANIGAVTSAVIDKMDEANASHKELISIQNKPEQDSSLSAELNKQIDELEARHNWLKKRIESHNNALSYWDKHKGGVSVE